MRKAILTLGALAAMILCVPSESAMAIGRGEKSLGVMGGFATYNSGGYMNVNFQYAFADHFRIAPEVGYVFRNKGKSAFEISCDMHFPFRLAKGFGIYPLVGLTFNNWTIDTYPGSENWARFGGDFGLGFDIYFTSYLKMSIQGKYSLMNDTSGGFFGLGMSYVF